ncbi:MAG: GntR family transcriptional regulator [Rhizobiales bacterium]|nr:GntR family transcriptional regulator [Hyphomicrobiales bacterium]MBA69137.1 GntR family transcriptional regulator [Hyphomicrobiales bacterium]|tara:strand:+ start:417 stop:1136 length:720 start_codon:yes stop_codon:yes gene_type:complete
MSGKPIIQEAISPGLAQGVIDDVRAYIRENGLKPGDTVPSENAFAERAGVSRTVGREAFRALATLGILSIGNGRRAKVAAPDSGVLGLILDHTVQTKQQSIQQILAVRRTLELRTASLAALRRTDAEADEIMALTGRMRENLDTPDLIRDADIAFHERIAAASRNPLFTMLVGSFSIITRQTWQIGWISRGTKESRLANIECHERLGRAIGNQNPVEAEAIMDEHFESAISVLVRAGVG